MNEFFSVYALDYINDEHLGLFNKWQNDSRVAQGWNKTGTLDQHRLRKIQEDPHQIAVLAKFNNTFFSYHEIYWTKVWFLYLSTNLITANLNYRRTILVRITMLVAGTGVAIR